MRLCGGNVRNERFGKVHSPKEGKMNHFIQFLLWYGSPGPLFAGLAPGAERLGTAENEQGSFCYGTVQRAEAQSLEFTS